MLRTEVPLVTRRTLRATLLATGFALSLACGGALDAIAPEPPVPAPEGSTTTSVNTAVNNGVGTTTMDYTTDEKPGTVFKHYKGELTDDGWEVSAQKTDGGGILTANKDGDTFTVTIGEGEFQTVWTTH